MFPKVPQSSLGILRVPQLPPPLEHPPLRNPTTSPPRLAGEKTHRRRNHITLIRSWMKRIHWLRPRKQGTGPKGSRFFRCHPSFWEDLSREPQKKRRKKHLNKTTHLNNLSWVSMTLDLGLFMILSTGFDEICIHGHNRSCGARKFDSHMGYLLDLPRKLRIPVANSRFQWQTQDSGSTIASWVPGVDARYASHV